MPHSSDISDVMHGVLLKLMAATPDGSDHGWRALHDQLQEWKVNVEWDHPGIGADRSADTAQAILEKLKTLPDRALAADIRHVVIRHTRAHAQSVKTLKGNAHAATPAA